MLKEKEAKTLNVSVLSEPQEENQSKQQRKSSSFRGAFSLEQVSVYGHRVTTLHQQKRVLSNGKTRRYTKQRFFLLQGKQAVEELVYYVGRTKHTVQKEPVALQTIYPMIHHVYDKNGVLIARKKNKQLRSTARGLSRNIQ